ncbi:MAG: hydantoinase B/oxoprolinase family protein [Dehalococcoidia bacterium]
MQTVRVGYENLVDPVTREVLQRRLTSIADEMQATLLRSAFSIIVKEGGDASSAVFDAQGQTVAQALAVPMHLGSLTASVPGILKKHPTAEMQDGDVYIANDPYRGGTHIPDITVMAPIFHGGEVVALGCTMAHHQDMGAITPGVPATSTSIFQEGLNLPPLKLYAAGRPNETIHAVLRNNVRIPDIVLGDLGAQTAACNTGKARFLELVEEYGIDVIRAAINELQDYAERLTRREISGIADGTYTFEDYMDNDGVDLDKRIKISVAVTIKGSQMEVDFSGTSPQVKGPYNIPPSGAITAASYAIRAVSELDIPNNAGYCRPINVITPRGTLVNPKPPAPVGARAATAARLVDTVLGAFARALPDRVIAASGGEPLNIFFGGFDPNSNKEFVGNEVSRSGLGARPTKDGVDVICTDIANRGSIPVEALEKDFPLRVVRYGLHNGSGGPGKYRGGLGLEKVYELTRGQNVTVTFRGERHYTSPWGLYGGLPGANAKAYVVCKGGKTEHIPSKRDFTMNAGDKLHIFTPGGGGYGDPLERDLALVLQDVLDARISPSAAEEDYGVVIDLESEAVDLAKTRSLRQEKAQIRGPITWIYDRGPESDGRSQ